MFSHPASRRSPAAALALCLVLIGRFAAAEPNHPANSETCRNAIRHTEAALDLPIGILQAISLAESGRWDKESRSKFAWPWTVTARGKGEFYPSRSAAIAAVKQLKAEGVRNIDVGCMQINLLYHPDAFETLDEAFDPIANARYAADLFARLRAANRSITRAVSFYHSTTREYYVPYTKKVIGLWNEERQRHFAEERLRKIEAWRTEHARRLAGAAARRAGRPAPDRVAAAD